MPNCASEIYPNPVQFIFDTPAVVFRDHRWVLPVICQAAETDLLKIPVLLVTFDRHKDALRPEDRAKVLPKIRKTRCSFKELINLVKYHLSPRDDDWIVSGMELGLISDAVQFGSAGRESEDSNGITEYVDSDGLRHRIFHLDRPLKELSYKGALVDNSHDAVQTGLWDVMGWSPAGKAIAAVDGSLLLDFDLDYFTVTWDTYTLPYSDEIYEGEFNKPCQSRYYDDYRPSDFVREIAFKAGIITIATEPHFCGGAEKSQRILDGGNRHLFEDRLCIRDLAVDYPPQYPTE